MLLQDRIAVIHGGGGAIGGAVARTFADEGAHVHLVGRTHARLQAVADAIVRSGGRVSLCVLDVMDAAAVDADLAALAGSHGRIDIAMNAIGIGHVQGVPFRDLALADVLQPVQAYVACNFITAQAAARYMRGRGSGVLMTLSTPGARMTGTGFLGNGVASAAVEAFSRLLAGELGADGIRVICLRPDALPEAVAHSHTGEVFDGIARGMGITVEAMLARRAQDATLLKRLPTLQQVADYAAFAASDRAGAMTGVIANLSCGSLVD
jgi:NAD(P)-dependent dehydrogenase (short-subunit alcohol dehydrogenase family)